ncbi:hypothetical protein GND96_09205 [Citrobacter sp. JL976]|uniref:hypothetical protein n=1 Tax=Citrobacter sp. JL976 TaxID=2652397 RepID=UPI0012D94F99|nr:hypothetical protein [Citrobacter sp. JL976]MTW55583.1 hypothetical protein [Citrobacter sp. JL976]
MTDKREIALEQALIAVLAVAKESKLDLDTLVLNANSVILDSAHKNNIVDDKSIRTSACEIIRSFVDQL